MKQGPHTTYNVRLSEHVGGPGMSKTKLSKAERSRLLKRADELVGCTENLPEAKELEAIADQLDGYEQ